MNTDVYRNLAHEESAHAALPPWKDALLRCAVQSPLLRTDLTLRGLHVVRERPRAIVLGVGLSARGRMSAGLPFDVIGMLLAAEQLRRAAGARRIVALIADRHALTNGFSELHVAPRAREVERQLHAVQRALRLPLHVVRASTLHARRSHAALVRRVERCAGSAHPYVTLQVADTEWLRRRHGAIVKLGWALDARPCAASSTLDERLFDQRFREWVGSSVGFAYVRAGRTFDLGRPLAAPYLVIDAGRRLLLSPDEREGEKLERFLAQAPREARGAVMRHLRRITRVYDRAIAPLDGTVTERVRDVLDHIYRGERETEAAE